MKICILGPTTSASHFGGVATYNEGLSQGFLDNNDEVMLITNTKNTKFKNAKYYSKFDFIINKKRIIKQIKKFKPDIIISSMWYGILNKKARKKISSLKTIHILHGFPTYRYSKMKRFFLNKTLMKIRKNTDYFVSNSAFTSCINTEIYGIRSDRVVHLGLREEFQDFDKKIEKGMINFTFAGRVVETKNVEKICEIFQGIMQKRDDVKLTIVGDGNLKDTIEEKYKCDKIVFLGKKSREETLQHLEKSDIFISLNPHEPFGLVFLEALLKKCKIVCPNTGGHTEFLRGFNEVLFIDIYNLEESVKKIIELIDVKAFDNVDLKKWFENFTFSRVAKDLIDIGTSK